MIVVILLSALSGCNWNKSKYPETVKSNLVESDDYIDHALTYDGKGLTYDKSMWYVNDLKDVPLADPHIYVEDGKYYIVGTSDRDNGVIDCYTTVDFVTYTIHKAIYDPTTFEGWEADKAEIYAPEMYCFDGVYYMYYSAMDKGQTDPDGISRRRNSVVVADSPLGPYRPLQNDKVDGLAYPIFLDQNIKFGVLDITVFVDDDKQMYM